MVTERIPRRFGLHPITDIQVLTPMNRGGLGAQSLLSHSYRAIHSVRLSCKIRCVAEVDNSHVSRMVNLTTVAADIVAAILDDALPNHITLFDLAVDPPVLWEEQRGRVITKSDSRR